MYINFIFHINSLRARMSSCLLRWTAWWMRWGRLKARCSRYQDCRRHSQRMYSHRWKPLFVSTTFTRILSTTIINSGNMIIVGGMWSEREVLCSVCIWDGGGRGTILSSRLMQRYMYIHVWKYAYRMGWGDKQEVLSVLHHSNINFLTSTMS